MRKRPSSRNAGSSSRNYTTLLRRLEDCNRSGSVEHAVKILCSRYPEYRRMTFAILTKNVQEALTDLKRKYNNGSGSNYDQVGLATSTSLSSSPSFELDSVLVPTDEQVSSPKIDLMKSMLREGYCHSGFESDKTEESMKKRKEKTALGSLVKEEEGNAIEDVVMLEGKTGGIEKKDLDLERGREQIQVQPMFKDFGGMHEVLEELKYNVLIPFRYPELLNRLNQLHAGPPTGILLHGPPGCGKTMLAQAIGNEAGVPLYQIAAPEIVSGVSGKSEENIRELFLKAHRTSPSIIFIDEIDAIADKRENSQKGMERRIITQLLKCMDNIRECATVADAKSSDSERRPHSSPENPETESRRGCVLVIGATNCPNSLDQALRRPGRFSWEIELGVPDENARFEILSVLTHDLGVQQGLNLRKLARDTQGFVGADLEEYVRKASLHAMRKVINLKKAEGINDCALEHHDDSWWKQLHFKHVEVETLCPTMADFEVAVKSVQPSLKREGFSTVPNVKWEDVGGLGTIRQEFQSCIINPIKYPEDYETFGEDLPAGFLLYGPPGCGKTLIAKAVANEAGASFIYIKGPELMNKYVGESELAVRKIFARARTCAPCILFFDEMDALTANRGESSGVTDRVLKQLLIELDGAEERQGVYVIGATNRPELIDRALLRPGRFEELFYIPLPSPQERGLILKALARKRPVDINVDLLGIAEMTACDNFSGADVACLMRRASRIAHQEMQLSKQSGSGAIHWIINTSHFEKALVGMAPSVNKKQREFYDSLSRSFKAT